MSDKEAVEAVSRAILLSISPDADPDVWVKGRPLWECYENEAKAAIAAARRHILEKAARDAIERAEIYEQSTTTNTPGYKDAAIALRAFAAAIRAAKEKGE